MDDNDDPPTITDLWTHRQTAWFLKITPGTLYVWVSKGVGPRSYKLNGSRRYDPNDVQTFLSQHTANSGGRDHGAA
jgi:hypothetical protein